MSKPESNLRSIFQSTPKLSPAEAKVIADAKALFLAEEVKNVARVREAFDRDALKRICEMPEEKFADAYEMGTVSVDQRFPADFYHFRDNGSNVLAVAHLDTVGRSWQRACNFLDTEGGPVVYSRALDDRLGAYVVLELLPALGITHDWLLTVGEEEGRSTAKFFEADKPYEQVIEFDRGGTDVVMYDYETDEMVDLVRASGARVGEGIFTDICYLEHLKVKGFNWGVGYQDYHGPRSHAYLEDTYAMIARYLRFEKATAGTVLPHEPTPPWYDQWPNRDDDRDDALVRWWEEHGGEEGAWLEEEDVVDAELVDEAVGEWSEWPGDA